MTQLRWHSLRCADHVPGVGNSAIDGSAASHAASLDEAIRRAGWYGVASPADEKPLTFCTLLCLAQWVSKGLSHEMADAARSAELFRSAPAGITLKFSIVVGEPR